MGAAQGGGRGPLVPDLGGAHHFEAVGQLGPVAERAVQVGPDAGSAAGFVEDPRRQAEGRVVADVLAMEAREVGDPGPIVVLVEADDGPPHGEKRRAGLEQGAVE